MSVSAVAQRARVILETEDAVYDLPTYGLDGRPAPLSLQPQEPFDQINMVGDTSKVSDRRANQIIPVDQRMGAGRDAYKETEGVTDYRQSDADPRFEGALVCRPKRTSLGTLTGMGQINPVLKYTGIANAMIHAYPVHGGTLKYHPGTGEHIVDLADRKSVV